MAADDWGRAMLARIRAARLTAPKTDQLRPVLEDAARYGAQAAQVRRQSARAHIETTPTGLQLRFSGPGARHAHAVARQRLAVTLPAAVQELRTEALRRLKG